MSRLGKTYRRRLPVGEADDKADSAKLLILAAGFNRLFQILPTALDRSKLVASSRERPASRMKRHLDQSGL
jgi:uncharacterized lipoprotein